MNYNNLRYFSVLAQVEHYTLAAARLGISQPSLSSAIHNLETELGGVKLFENIIRVDSAVEWSQDNSVPVVAFKKNSRSANEYVQLAKEIEK